MRMKKKIRGAIALLLCVLLSGCGAPGRPSPSAGASSHSNAADQIAPESPLEEAGSAEANSGESYLVIDQNQAKSTEEESMLTFSLKVDTAAYSNVQRYLESGSLPPKDAVRTEELINYFGYDEPVPAATRNQPFSIYTETAPSPFDPAKQIAFIRVKTPEIDKKELPPSNLTFLIDTSGSMNSYDKLPLLKQAFAMLAETLGENDRVSIVTYAGSAGVVLDSAPGNNTRSILSAFSRLSAGGSTAGAEGIAAAYALAEKNFIKNGNNRVILATDGDFNVGPESNEELSKLIQRKRDSGIYLSILGFGTGNIRDDLMETLSKDGNGNYAYINSLHTAEKVLVEELSSSLYTVANDVKAQIEFNPQNVASYRLIGYENRALDNKDFANDSKDAGEIGVGTDVVVLFELEMRGANGGGQGLKYQPQSGASSQAASEGVYADELFEVRIRYKDPGESESKLVTQPVKAGDIRDNGSTDLQFASAVAQFGELLRGADYLEVDGAEQIYRVAKQNTGRDDGGYRADFLSMVKQYQSIEE